MFSSPPKKNTEKSAFTVFLNLKKKKLEHNLNNISETKNSEAVA